MIDKEIWEELEKLDEFATFPQDKLPGHLKHLRDYNLESVEEYQEFTDLLTKYPAVPIGKGTLVDMQGYIAQDRTNAKFIQMRGDKYALGVYEEPVDGETAITNYPKKLQNILRDADPYRFYRRSIKQSDYRYKSDLDGGFEGLKFFDNHPEYHQDTPEEVIEEIRRRLINGEELGAFNTDEEV